MNNKRVLAYALGAVLSIVLLLGVSIAKASSGSFLDVIGKVAGEVLGNRLADKVELPSDFSLPPVEEQNIGVGGDTYATRPMALIIIPTTTGQYTAPTSTPAGYNSSNKVRRITKIEYYARGTNTTYLGGPLILDFSTSTASNTSSTVPIFSSTLTTSTDSVNISTSTFSQTWKSFWRPGEYVQCVTNRVVSTTDGYCVVEFYPLQ